MTSAPSRAPGSAPSLAAPSPAMVVRTMRRGWSGGCPRPRCSGCPRERGRAAAVRDDLRGQRGALGRDAPAGAVGVPLVVALRQEALVASALPDVGEHDDSWARPDVAGGQAPLQRAETAAEGDLHRLGKMLAGKTRTANACHARSRAANVLSSSAASRTPRTVAPGVASAGVLSSVKPPPSRDGSPAPFRHRRRSRSPGGHRPA